MEAEDGYNPTKTVAWKGDWDLFKRQFKAAAKLSGIDNAIKVGEKLAKDEDLKIHTEEDPKLMKWAQKESPMLHARLVLALSDTIGAQQALIESGIENDEKGIGVWTRLVKHFEFSTKRLRTRELHTQWARETLKPGERPTLLHARLVSLQRQMAALGEILSDENLAEKFITGVEEGNKTLYNPVISGYNREIVMGRNQTIEQLLELMGIEFRSATQASTDTENMVGLASVEQCSHCRKPGHCAEDCWVKHPAKRPVRKLPRPKQESRKCFKCGKVGHLKRDCRTEKQKESTFASIYTNKNTISIDCYQYTYVDSASSCHTVTSLQMLDQNTAERVNKTVRAVDGTEITLTHRGKSVKICNKLSCCISYPVFTY